ncbi:hypothetical protein QBC32DRAFT_159241 [Pseudoneurospora amorphoporcata]|uniref:Uncharacterized protein n=1 Tax=Pseudoneurospora amorphoporcata TaxID=241081 RepID=A0AAN6NIL0_9PEZI|nr:hypothetical protein QBC32DRAFT_159241 [Pseudoneurospora amorphoporcata]
MSLIFITKPPLIILTFLVFFVLIQDVVCTFFVQELSHPYTVLHNSPYLFLCHFLCPFLVYILHYGVRRSYSLYLKACSFPL